MFRRPDGLNGESSLKLERTRRCNPDFHCSEFRVSTKLTPLVRQTGKAGRDRESQKTCLDHASRKSLRGRGCEGKGFCFYPQLSEMEAGVFIWNKLWFEDISTLTVQTV